MKSYCEQWFATVIRHGHRNMEVYPCDEEVNLDTGEAWEDHHDRLDHPDRYDGEKIARWADVGRFVEAAEHDHNPLPEWEGTGRWRRKPRYVGCVGCAADVILDRMEANDDGS